MIVINYNRACALVEQVLKPSVDRIHAVQSLTQIFTEVVQIRRTSGQVRVQNLCKQIEDWFTWQVKLIFYKLSWKNLIWICVQSKVNWPVLSMKSLWNSKTPPIYCFCCSKLWVEAVVVTWLVKWHQTMTISNFLYSLCATVLLHCHFCAVSSIVIYELTLRNTVLSIFFWYNQFSTRWWMVYSMG